MAPLTTLSNLFTSPKATRSSSHSTTLHRRDITTDPTRAYIGITLGILAIVINVFIIARHIERRRAARREKQEQRDHIFPDPVGPPIQGYVHAPVAATASAPVGMGGGVGPGHWVRVDVSSAAAVPAPPYRV